MQYNLTEDAMMHFHALELLETFKKLKAVTNSEVAIENILSKITRNDYESDIIQFLMYTNRSTMEQDYQKIAYYLASGCGIVRIIDLLKTNQYQIYKVKDTFEEKMNNLDHHIITIMFRNHPDFIESLQDYMKHFNLFDGFRIIEPSKKGIYLPGQVKSK